MAVTKKLVHLIPDHVLVLEVLQYTGLGLPAALHVPHFVTLAIFVAAIRSQIASPATNTLYGAKQEAIKKNSSIELWRIITS